MRKGLRNLGVGFSLSIVLLSFGLVYWQVVRADDLQKNPNNRRLVYMEQRVVRGGIFDRNGEILAQTKIDENGKKSRVYPKGESVQPLVGYASLNRGSAGLEAYLGDWLLGLKDATPTQFLERTFQLPREGNDVVLTLDYSIQKVAYEGLKGKAGAAVAIDPRDGRVLALVSQPSFDANRLDEDWNEIVQKPGSPFLNHAFALFPPGSVMKVVTSSAIIRSGVDTTELHNCTGSTVINGQVIPEQNARAHGWVNYNRALAASCNTYFSIYGVASGDEAFIDAAKRFGFGQRIPFELLVNQSKITKDEAIPKELNDNQLAASSFGQGEVLVSPFHMALITAGIANEGVIMTPYLVDRVLGPNQELVYKSSSEPWLTALTPEEAQKIKSAMITAVNDGTAAPGGIANFQVAAKTGSAEPGGNVRPHAWYIAFAPAESPRIAVAVLVENGGTGSGVAAPIAKAMMETVLNQKEGESR